MSETRKTKDQPAGILGSVDSGGNPQSNTVASTSNRFDFNSASKSVSISGQDLVVDTDSQIVNKHLNNDQSSPERAVASTSITNASSQLRSTLAIGQLIASNRPTAGSRLIASELRHLSNSIQEESASIRKEIASLSTNLASSLKNVMEEDREQRSMVAGTVMSRRPMFGQFGNRRFPVFRRRPLGRMNAGTNTLNSISPTPVPSPDPSTAASSSSAMKMGIGNAGARKQLSIKSSGGTIARKSFTLFKNPWLPGERSSALYDGESDSDSTDTTPSSTP